MIDKCFKECFIMVVGFFQEFEDYRDADDAVYELNGKELLGERYKLTVVADELFQIVN